MGDGLETGGHCLLFGAFKWAFGERRLPWSGVNALGVAFETLWLEEAGVAWVCFAGQGVSLNLLKPINIISGI